MLDAIDSLPWFHQMDLAGQLTPGVVSLVILNAQANIYFRHGVEGLSVLDVGCIDGFNSFEAERRNAKRVLATDHYSWHSGYNCRSFEIARAALRSRVEVMDIDLPDLVPEKIGHFDVVLFCGVLYHLRNPFAALERLAPVATSLMVVETHMNALDEARPAMIFSWRRAQQTTRQTCGDRTGPASGPCCGPWALPASSSRRIRCARIAASSTPSASSSARLAFSNLRLLRGRRKAPFYHFTAGVG